MIMKIEVKCHEDQNDFIISLIPETVDEARCIKKMCNEWDYYRAKETDAHIALMDDLSANVIIKTKKK